MLERLPLIGRVTSGHRRVKPHAGAAEALLSYRMTGLDPAEVDRFLAGLDFPRQMPREMHMQVSGEIDGSLFFETVWSSRAAARDFYESRRADLDRLLGSSPDSRLSRQSLRMIRYELGPSAERFANDVTEPVPGLVAQLFDVDPGSVEVYERLYAASRKDPGAPEGLIAHAVGVSGSLVHGLEIWQSAVHARDFFERRLMPAGLVVAREIGRVPPVAPRSAMVNLVAINRSTLAADSKAGRGIRSA